MLQKCILLYLITFWRILWFSEIFFSIKSFYDFLLPIPLSKRSVSQILDIFINKFIKKKKKLFGFILSYYVKVDVFSNIEISSQLVSNRIRILLNFSTHSHNVYLLHKINLLIHSTHCGERQQHKKIKSPRPHELKHFWFHFFCQYVKFIGSNRQYFSLSSRVCFHKNSATVKLFVDVSLSLCSVVWKKDFMEFYLKNWMRIFFPDIVVAVVAVVVCTTIIKSYIEINA